VDQTAREVNHADLRRPNGIPCPHFDTAGENRAIGQTKSEFHIWTPICSPTKRLLE
jgi:hypothetical protein